MPSFADSIFLFVLALLLFGPKKLPVLARELGKWVGEFRRASNEFKMQMEDELRVSEQADRQKQIAAMEAAAPLPPPLEEPEHPHLPRSAAQNEAVVVELTEPKLGEPDLSPASAGTEDFSKDFPGSADEVIESASAELPVAPNPRRETLDGVRPIPIATSGELKMMPPTTGLPSPRARGGDPLGGLLEAIPQTEAQPRPAPEPAFADAGVEKGAHGD